MRNYSTATKQGIKQAEESNSNNYKKIIPPFSYFGSKNKIALQLCEELPPHNCWVEAFCGSASLTLAKPSAPIEVINDVDGEIVNVFKQLRENSVELLKLLELTPYARLEFESARVKNEDDSDLERARKFLIQAMMAINGIFGDQKGGFSYSQSYSRNGRDARVNRWVNLPNRLSKVVDRLKDLRIDNKDAVELLKMFTARPATLVYLDPPYLGNRTKGYTNDLNDKEYHENLLQVANNSLCMIFISGYENDLYNDLLSEQLGWSKKVIPTTTKGTNGVSFKREEIVWMNARYQEAVERKKIPIDLTEKEIKQKKLNPKR